MSMDRRPTPADPMPGGRPEGRSPSDLRRELPPELGPNAVAVLEGVSFMYSDALGDVPRGSIGGFVHEDTRLLNRWELTLNGSPLLALDSSTADHYSAAFFLTNAELPGLPANRVGVRRQRFVGDGLHERIDVQCFAREPLSSHGYGRRVALRSPAQVRDPKENSVKPPPITL
jgi:glycogen debranching enzyme-like protein